MVLTLSLVRHGQTHFNAQHRLQGWCDSALTPQGLAGVRTTATFLSGRPFTAAYVSPSGRAQDITYMSNFQAAATFLTASLHCSIVAPSGETTRRKPCLQINGSSFAAACAQSRAAEPR